MGLDNYLVDKIFNLIDEDKDGKASFEDFVKYLNVLMNGSKMKKALWSFSMLANKKGYLTLEDIE